MMPQSLSDDFACEPRDGRLDSLPRARESAMRTRKNKKRRRCCRPRPRLPARITHRQEKSASILGLGLVHRSAQAILILGFRRPKIDSRAGRQASSQEQRPAAVVTSSDGRVGRRAFRIGRGDFGAGRRECVRCSERSLLRDLQGSVNVADARYFGRTGPANLFPS